MTDEDTITFTDRATANDHETIVSFDKALVAPDLKDCAMIDVTLQDGTARRLIMALQALPSLQNLIDQLALGESGVAVSEPNGPERSGVAAAAGAGEATD